MTYPITPDPGIHRVPSGVTQQKALFNPQQLLAWAQQLPLAMTLALVDAILKALGATQSQIDAVNADATTIYDEVESWLSGANSSSSAANWNQVITDVQAVIDDIRNLFSGNNDINSTLAQLVTDGEAALSALLPGVFNFGDGTSAPSSNSNVTVNSDGTALYTQLENSIYALFDNLDGTTMSHAAVVQNVGTGVGTNQYSVDTATTAYQNIVDTWIQQYGVPAVNYITTVEQDIANFFNNSITGGNAPTSPNSPVGFLDGLLNFIPHTNVVIPPSPGTGSITHDANASGTPYTSFTNNFITINYNHTCAATANYLTVQLGFYAIYLPVISVTYSGISLSPLVSVKGTDGDTYAMIYGLANPPTGTAQVSVTMYSPLGNAIESVVVESDSYIGVGSVSTTAAANGSGSNPALTVPSATGDYIIQTFFNSGSLGAGLSSYNQTSQYNSGNQNPLNGPHVCLLAGDAAGAASVSFTATATDTTVNRWAAAAVNLTPLPATVIGSVFRAANTSTSSVSAASGNNFFPNSFFNSTTGQPTSTDLTYSAASGNTVTITHAGTYSVTIAVLLVSTFSAQLLGLSLQQNFAAGGASLKRGHTSYVNNPGFSTNYVVSHTFQVYCSAGDTLQPCYYSSVSGSAFTGTTDGLSTYFEVSLNNRGLHS